MDVRKYAAVKGHSGLMKHKTTGVVLNINTNEINEAKKRKRLRQEEKEEYQALKDDVAEIKVLLNKLLEVTNGNNNG